MPSQPRKHTKTQTFPSNPSQELAMRLRQRWGIERTPGECRTTLINAIKLFRAIMAKGGKYLPPWDYNALKVIMGINARSGVFEFVRPDGRTELSACSDGEDWDHEMGTL